MRWKREIHFSAGFFNTSLLLIQQVFTHPVGYSSAIFFAGAFIHDLAGPAR
jgi:hypothetical protein